MKNTHFPMKTPLFPMKNQLIFRFAGLETRCGGPSPRNGAFWGVCGGKTAFFDGKMAFLRCFYYKNGVF
jgi:hypothetical protein